MTNRKNFLSSVIILVIVIGVGAFSLQNNGVTNGSKVKQATYSATEVLENANFDAENPFIEVEAIHWRTEDTPTRFIPIEISKETQMELLVVFENATFKKADSTRIDFKYNYWIKITLSRGYTMFVDSNKSFIHFDEEGETYIMENGEEFFSRIENIDKGIHSKNNP